MQNFHSFGSGCKDDVYEGSESGEGWACSAATMRAKYRSSRINGISRSNWRYSEYSYIVASNTSQYHLLTWCISAVPDSNIISQKMDQLRSLYRLDHDAYIKSKGSPTEQKFITDTLQKEQTGRKDSVWIYWLNRLTKDSTLLCINQSILALL